MLSDGAAVYTPGVSERRGSTTSYFQTDRLGTHKNQTSTSQTITATRTHDAFGNVLSTTGSPASPFGFAGDWGYQEDADHGFKLLGHRYYDPSTGRFLTRDPIKDGRNWYAYCDGNPVSYLDVDGHSKGSLIRFIRNGKWIKFIITPGNKHKKKLVNRLGGLEREDPGHNGGPTHTHPKANTKLHICTAAEADEAKGFPWDNWRNHAKPVDLWDFLPFLVLLFFGDKYGAAMEGGILLGKLIDPYTNECNWGYNGWTNGARAFINPQDLYNET